MAFIGEFDSSTVAPRSTPDALPEDKYVAQIIGSKEKTNNDGEGSRISLTLQVVAGPYEGRLFWDNLHLKNKSKQAVEFSKATLSSICAATGVRVITDTLQLHDIPMLVTVKCKEYEDRETNVVTKYEPKSALVTPPAQAQGDGQAPAASPWSRPSQ